MKLKQKMENEEIQVLTKINTKTQENISSSKLILNPKMKRTNPYKFCLSFSDILIILSIIITLIAGLIPSHGAAKQDPVIALRTE